MNRARSLFWLGVLSVAGLVVVGAVYMHDVPDLADCARPIEMPSSIDKHDSVKRISVLPDGRILVRGFKEFYVLTPDVGKIQSVAELADRYSPAFFSPEFAVPLKSGQVALVTSSGIVLLEEETVRVLYGYPIPSWLENIVELPNGDVLVQSQVSGVVRFRADGSAAPEEKIRSLLVLDDGRVLGWDFWRLWLYSTDEMQLVLDLADRKPGEGAFVGPTIDGSDQVIAIGGLPFRVTPQNQVAPIPIVTGSAGAETHGYLRSLQISGQITAGLFGTYVAILRNGTFLVDPFEGRVGPVLSLQSLEGGGFFVQPSGGNAGIINRDGTAQTLDPSGKWPSVNWDNVDAYRISNNQVALLESFYVPSTEGQQFESADLFLVGEDGEMVRLTDDDIPLTKVHALSNGTVLIHSLAGLFEITSERELRRIEGGGKLGWSEIIETPNHGVLLGISEGIFRLESDLSVVKLIQFPSNEIGTVELVSTESGGLWTVDQGILYQIDEECLAP